MAPNYVSSWEAFRLNRREYGKRFRRGFKYAVLFFVLTALVAMVAAFFIRFVSTEDDYLNALKSTSSTAAGVATPINIDETGVHANSGEKQHIINADASTPRGEGADLASDAALEKDTGAASHFDVTIFTVCILEAFIIVVLGMGFSGAFAAVFLTPINPIKFAPYGLLDKERSCLKFRCWICYPSGKFLHDVKITIGYAYRNMYSKSALTFGGDTGDPQTFGVVEVKECGRLRGVWDLDIPLDDSVGRELYKVFTREGDKNPVVRITIKGITDSGEVVEREARYNRLRILVGYIFASYHFPYEDDPEMLARYSNYKTNKPWFANFSKVIERKQAIKGRKNGAVNCGVWEPRVDRGAAQKQHYRNWKSLLRREWKSLPIKTKIEQESQRRSFTAKPTIQWHPELTMRDCARINDLSKYI